MSALFGSSTHHLSGTVTHPREWDNTNPTPIGEQKVEVYARWFFLNWNVGSFTTNSDGSYDFDYKATHMPFSDSHQINLLFKRATAPYKGIFSSFFNGERTVFEQTFPIYNAAEKIKSLNIEAKILEYLPERAGLKVPEKSSYLVQRLTPAYIIELVRAALGTVIIRLKSIVSSFFQSKTPTVASVEDSFGIHDPNLRVSADTTLDMILNGIYPCNWLKINGDPNRLMTEINWDRCEQDESPQLPNAKLYVERKNDELSIIGVEIQFGRDREPLSYNPEDPGFNYALGVFNCSALVKGEVVSHLGMGHIWTEQAAMAVFRHIRPDTALGKLLHPHLRDVFEINRLGASAIFGPEGVLNVSGLTVKGISEAIDDLLAGMDYSFYGPREPLCSKDTFGQAKVLFWNCIDEWVEDYFEKNDMGIEEQMQQIRYMSQDLHQHSRPFRPWEGVANHSRWLDGSEVDPSSKTSEERGGFFGRTEFQGKARAVRPMHQGNEVNTDQLKQFCKFTVFMSTFWHSWVHMSQEKWSSNLKVASLAPRNDARGDYFDTAPDSAKRQLTITSILLNFDPHTIFEDTDGDVLESLKEMLTKDGRSDRFKELGFPVEEVLRSVQI